LLLALFFPVLRWLAGEWLGNDFYSHGALVPFISGFLAWRLWARRPPAMPLHGGSWGGSRSYTDYAPIPARCQPGVRRKRTIFGSRPPARGGMRQGKQLFRRHAEFPIPLWQGAPGR